MMFADAAKETDMAPHFNRFDARIDGLSTFLWPAAFVKAVSANLRLWVALPDGTRDSAAPACAEPLTRQVERAAP